MSHVKTAISIRESLFKEADALARQMNMSRSRLFVLAVEEFIRQHQNQQLLKQIDQAYVDEPDPTEQEYLSNMKLRHRQLVEGEW
jgi:metal-responsive CopG/Arc/MetJ family transcriptional regulator